MVADINMQTIPLAAVVTDGEKVPEQELLPTTPDGDLEDIKVETGNKEKEISPEADGESVPSIHSEKSAWSLIFEACVVTILAMIPYFFIWEAFNYNEYSLMEVKGPKGLNPFQEFYRWTLFIVISYDFFVLAQLPFRPLTSIVLWLCKKFRRELTRNERVAILCLRYAAEHLGMALAFFAIFFLADTILYEPNKDIAAAQIFRILPAKEKARAQQLLIGDQIERLLGAVFVFSLWIALERYIVAAIRSSFHRIAIGPRAAQCNKKFEILAVLNRACQTTNRTTLSTVTLTSGGTEEQEEIALTQDTTLDLDSATRARATADKVFRLVCPSNRETIAATDFKAYFAVWEYGNAFRIFDSNRKGELDKHDFRAAVSGIYEERFRLAKAIVTNNQIVVKLDWTLLVIFGILGLLLALVMYNSRGYGWVTSMGTFFLGFSFLFRTTMSKVFDTFLFVFVEHAYDVNDGVLVDNERFTVQEIEIFTTIFVRFDGTLVYSPNGTLKGKTIYNKQRMAVEQDEIIATINASTPISQLAKLRSKTTDYLTETVNEFTGTVNVNIIKFVGNGADRKVRLKVESKYRPKDGDLRSDLALHERRANLLEKFETICEELDVDYTIEDADK